MAETKRKARVIACYLPQYHPIPENDEWWGKGFTEWTNVAKARPLFKGHYQPRIPADLGFYDLRMAEIREAQADMARKVGIEGFMYWNYWLGNGRKLLERPFEEVLKSKKPDFPFCIGWANHSWTTNSWNAATQWEKDSNLIEQQYLGEKDYENYFYYLLPAFQDERYIKVEGKPFFLIWDSMASPEIKVFINVWRNLAIKNNLKGIHFVGRRHGMKNTFEQILDFGYDAVSQLNTSEAEAIAFGNKWIKALRNRLVIKFGGITLMKFNFKKISENLFNEKDKLENSYPNIVPQYDRTARSGRKASIYYGSTPEIFGKQIDNALDIIKNKSDEHKILILKSWNEWGEGNYVEPDTKYGWGYLDEIKKRILM